MIVSAWVRLVDYQWPRNPPIHPPIVHVAIGRDYRRMTIVDRMLVLEQPHNNTLPIRVPFEHVYGIYDDGRPEAPNG